MSALDRARQLQPGSTVRWDRLERDAFAAHPDVLSGTKQGKRRPARWEWPLLVLVLVVAAVAFGSPIWGFVAVAERGSRFSSYPLHSNPHDTIPVAGSFYLCALVVLLATIVMWLWRGRPIRGTYFGFAVLAAILGTMTAFRIRSEGRDGGVETWDQWIIPVVVVTVLSSAFALVLIVVKFWHLVSATTSFEDSDELDARRARVAGLDESERGAIQADLDAAIADLEQRGLVSASLADGARGAELGALAQTMKSASTV